MELSLLGIGLVTALGAGIEALAAALRGERKPRIEEQQVHLQSGPVRIPVYIAQPEGLDRFVPASALRRIDRFSQMALLAGCLAMEDARIEMPENRRVATVFGLGYGALQSMFDFEDSVFQFGDSNPSPTVFSRSVTNAIASSVATRLKLEGPSFTITSFESTVAGAFAITRNLLVSQMADYVLLGLGDEYHPARGYATALLAGSDFRELKPSAWDQCTYIPGEGFAAFLVTRPDTSAKYGNVSSYLRNTVATQDVISGQSSVILDACGDKARSSEYNRLKFAGSPVSYAHLFGAMPTGAAMDLAVAALGWKEQKFYTPDSDPQPVSSDGIFCVSAIGPGQFHTLRVHGS